jgi:hypothetical protein
MSEYFVVANSFAAPFVSDKWEQFVQGETPEAALTLFAENSGHPCGLYSAELYADANAYHKRDAPLARWLCKQAEKQRLTKDLGGSYSYLGHGPGVFEINGEWHMVEDPKGGALVKAA